MTATAPTEPPGIGRFYGSNSRRAALPELTGWRELNAANALAKISIETRWR